MTAGLTETQVAPDYRCVACYEHEDICTRRGSWNVCCDMCYDTARESHRKD